MVNRYVHQAPLTQKPVLQVKSWEGNAGTIIVNTPAQQAAVVSSLQAQGYNETGSPAATRAMSLAIQQTQEMTMAKGGFYPTGSPAAAAAMAEAQDELRENIQTFSTTQPNAANMGLAEYPSESPSSASPNILIYLLIGGAALLLLSRK